MNLIKTDEIHSKIFTIRGKQVMLDRDLAVLYNVQTKVLNQAVKRNKDRFPENFSFQLRLSEKNELVTNCDQFSILKHSSALPHAFAWEGCNMLATILKSDVAVQRSIIIVRTITQMEKSHSSLLPVKAKPAAELIAQAQMFLDMTIKQAELEKKTASARRTN